MGLIDVILDKFGLVRKKSWEQLWASVMEDKILYSGVSPREPYKSVSNVYKAVKAIADNVPQAELVLKDWRSGEPASDANLERLLEEPNPFMSQSDFIQAVVGFYVLYGETFIVKDMDTVSQAVGEKLPYGLYTFNPQKFQPILEGGKNDRKELKGWRFGDTVFTLSEVIHIKDFNPYDEVRGLSPLEPAELNIDVDYAALLYNRAFFENDATPGLALATDQKLNEQIVERIRKKWEARHKGVGKAFKVAILEAGLRPVNLSYSHKDMDFIEQRRYAREEILGIWRVPKALFNITEDLNYATFMGQMKIFWLYTLAPILRKIEDGLNRGLVYPYNNRFYLEFDYSNVPAFQEDFKEKVEVAKVLFEMGFTANEINERLGLGFESKPWRDNWWIPVTLLPAGSSVDAGGDSDKGKSVVKTDVGASDDLKRKGFILRHNRYEKVLEGKVRRFFFEQRKRVLSLLLGEEGKGMNIKQDLSIVNRIDWDKEDEELKKLVEGILMDAISAGAEFGREITGVGVDEGLLSSALRSYLMVRAEKITRINDTVKRQIADSLKEGIIGGETINELADRVRDIYNMAGNRAKVISRTETTAAMNGGMFEYYKEAGIGKKRWITAADEAVRNSHFALHGEVRLMNESFSNGLRFPGDDGPPGEVINCRCVLDYIME